MPRGVKFRVELEGPSRGYVCENYGAHFRLPELGPIGTSGLANSRDFLSPVAAFEDRDGDFRVVAKFLGKLWEAEIDHSPLDIVAWHGTYVPYKYDLEALQCINTVTYDHPDPSIYCVLAAPTAIAGHGEHRVRRDRRSLERGARTRSGRRRFTATCAASSSAWCRAATSARPRASSRAARACTTACRATGRTATRSSAARAAANEPQYLADTMTIIFETQLVIRPTRVRARDRAARARLLQALARARQALSARVVRPGAPGRARTNFRPPLERSRHAPGEHRTPCGARLSSPQAVIDFELGEHLVGVLAEQRLT